MAVKDDVRLLDRRGWARSLATMPGYGKGRPPATKGRKYGPNPFTVTDMALLLDACVPRRPGHAAELSALRLSTQAILMYRTGLRVSEMLDLVPGDLDRTRRRVTVRNGKGSKRRVVRMDDWGWGHVTPWIEIRQKELPSPSGAVFCVISGPTAGWAMQDSDVRRQLAYTSAFAGLGRRANPHSFRHSFACDLHREGFTLEQIRRLLGHESLDTTMRYLAGMGEDELLDVVAMRSAPMMPLRPLA